MFTSVKRMKIINKKRIGLVVIDDLYKEEDVEENTPYMGITRNNIDIKVILLAMREHMLDKKLKFTNDFHVKGSDVIVPSLKNTFSLEYVGDYIIFRNGKFRSHRIPCTFDEDGQVSMEVIDYIVALVEHLQLN